MVGMLEEGGMVRKLDNALDGRSVVVRLTPAGRRRLRGRSEREITQLAQGLRILEEMLED
jgi:DNA-binding MarR family transcriptional regulator